MALAEYKRAYKKAKKANDIVTMDRFKEKMNSIHIGN